MMRLLSVAVVVVVCVWVGGWVDVQAGGFIGIFTALIAWYIGVAKLLTPDISYITLPLGDLGRKHLDLE
jgi:succinate-acetate transporter protein